MYEDDQQNVCEPDKSEQDIIEGVDEEGNKVLLQVEDYFFYDGQEYVVLTEPHDYDDACGDDCECCSHTCEHDHSDDDDEDEDGTVDLYIMKVIDSKDENGDEVEEFLPVDEDLMEKLIEVVQTNYLEDNDIEDDE